MFNNKNLIIIGEAVVILVLVFVLVRRAAPADDASDAYLEQLKRQNQELVNQLDRLKKNYVAIGLADSIESRTTDSLIAASGRRVNSLRQEAQTYRAKLEEMKTRKWSQLTEAQRAREIEDALNYLKRHEQNP